MSDLLDLFLRKPWVPGAIPRLPKSSTRPAKAPVSRKSVRTYQRWTPEEIDELFRLRDMGLTAAEIAKCLNTSCSRVESAVYLYRNRYPAGNGRPRSVWTDERLRELGQLLLDRRALADIARHFDIKLNYLHQVMHYYRDRLPR